MVQYRKGGVCVDYQLLFDSSITLINIILLLIVFIVPIVLIIFLIRKVVKYLDVKTEYYKKHMDDRQE